MAAKCRKFEPNVFNKNKCGVCFKSRNDHSASALESAKAARKLLNCGYLFIAPDVSARRWQRRFFVLYDDGELTYAVDENVDTVPQGTVDMNQCEDVFDAEQNSGHEFSFGIVVPPETHYVKGTSREEAIRWMELLSVYPSENAQNKVINRPRRLLSSSSPEDGSEASTPPGVQSEPLPNKATQPEPRLQRNSVPNGNPLSPTIKPVAKSTPHLPGDSDDELSDKFLKKDWYEPINNNQSSLGNLNVRQRRHTDVSITSEKPSLSSRQSSGSLDKSRLSKDRRKTQPEIRLSDAGDDAPRRRSSTDTGRNVSSLLGQVNSLGRRRECVEGAPGGPPPGDKRRRDSETGGDAPIENDENKTAHVLQEQNRTSQGSTDSETHVHMKKGWLHKLTPTGEWAKYWFVLCGQALKYYRDARAEEINDLDGRIDLKYCKEVREIEASKNYGLQIRNRNGTYTLSAMTSGIRSNWIHAISNYLSEETPSESRRKSQIQRRNTVPEVLPSDLVEGMEKVQNRKQSGRLERNVSSVSASSVKDRSELVVEGKPSDSRLLDSDNSDNSDVLVRQDSKTGKSGIEKKLDKLRSKVVSRTRSPPPKLASEVLKKAGESPDHGAVVHMLESEVDHLQSQLQKAHDEMVSLHDENSKLKVKFKQAKKKIKEQAEESGHPPSHQNISSLEEQIRHLQAENNAFSNEKSLVKLELENVRQENDLLHVKVRKLSEENGTLKRSFQSVTNENSGLRSDVKSFQSQLVKLQEANTGKHDELTDLIHRLDEYRNESRKHKKSCREKESQILEISEELQHKCEDYEDLTRKYNAVLNEIDKTKNFKVTSVKLERENANLRKELDEKTQDYSDVMNRYNELASEYQNLKSSQQDGKKITSNYVSNLKEHETLIKNLRQELENRTIDLTANEDRRVALETQLKDAKMTLKDSLHILDSQKSRVDEKDKQISELKQHIEQRNVERDELVNKYEDVLSKYNSLTKGNDSDLKEEINQLREHLNEKDRAYHDLEEKYHDVLDHLDEREEELEKVRDDLHDRNVDYEDLALKLDQLERELANARMTLMEHESGKPDMMDFGCSPGDGSIGSVHSVSIQAQPGDFVDLLTDSACQVSPILTDSAGQVEIATCDSASQCACPMQACLEPIPSSLVDKLKNQIHESEQKCDEMSVRNSALKLRINQMIDRYHDEVKFYSEKIDDLVTKLRAEQGKKKETSLETMLCGIENQIADAESALKMQASVENTLAQGMSELLDDNSSDTISEPTDTPNTLDERDDPLPESREKYDDDLLTRIQSLHNRVADSNVKLTRLFSLIDKEDESDSLSSVDINGKIKSFETRLSSIHSHIKEQETMTATTESLKSLVANHDRTLSVLDECETGLLTSLSSLNKTEQKREKLQAVVKTVNEMMEFANKEREVILQNKRQIQEALQSSRQVEKAVNVYAENVAPTSLMADTETVANRAQDDDFIRERDLYFTELQEATDRICELEETVDYLRNKYAQTRHHDVIVSLSDAVETYANVIAEGVVSHGLSEVYRSSQIKSRFGERDGLIREIRVANSKIRELENTVELQLTDREKLAKAQSFNHYVSLLTQQSQHHDSMFDDYQRVVTDIRHQQLNEFSQFTERLKQIEDKIGSMILGQIELPVIEGHGQDFCKEDWSGFSQAACLVGKAMGQAELVLKLHQLRDNILSCTSKQEQLRQFNQEIELSLSRLRNREKLMTDSIDKYKTDKLNNVSKLVVQHGLHGLSLTQSLHALVEKVNLLVNELSIFYKSMDMVGDQADLQVKLDACIQKEVELVSGEIENNCRGKTKPKTENEPLTQELLSSLLYNLADLLAQRAMVEAQFQYVSELLHKTSKNFNPRLTREESRPSSALSHRSEFLGDDSTMSLPIFTSDRRNSDVLETNVGSSSPVDRSATTTSSESSSESETDSETESESETKVTTQMSVDLKPPTPVKIETSTSNCKIVNQNKDLVNQSVINENSYDSSAFLASGDEVDTDLDRSTPDVFKFLHDPDFASSLRDPEVDYDFRTDFERRKARCASESDLIDSNSFDVVYNSTFSSAPNLAHDQDKARSKSVTDAPVFKSTLASRMRAAEAKHKQLHRSPAFRRRTKSGEMVESNPDSSKRVDKAIRPKPMTSPNKPPPTRSAGRRNSTPDSTKNGRRSSTPDVNKTPVHIPHSETRKVFVKSLRKPAPLKRGSPPKLTSPKKQEDRFVVSFGLSRGPVPKPSNDSIF